TDRADTDTDTTTTTSTIPTSGDAPTSVPDGDESPDPSAPTPSTPATAVPEVEWSDCGAGECATVLVPLDHDQPGGRQISLHVERLPATGERIGGLFFNFGGPGAGAADLIGRFGVPSSIREHFDIIGMDPRGVGRSTPLACGLDAATLYSADPTIEDETDVTELVGISIRYANDCEAAKGDVLPHLGTNDVARDMDLIRAGMGDDTLSYVGYSYGTSIGQAYAELFPDRVRAMILDGLVDPAPSGIDVAIEQAQGFETALANWAADCGRRSCGLSDPLAAVDRMLALAEDGVASSTDNRVFGPGQAAIGLAYPLYDQSLWGALDSAIAQAIDGDGAGMLRLADSYAGLVDFSIYFAVSCLDSTWPRSTDEFLARAKDAATVAPRFGEAIVNDYIRCAVWPVDPEPVGGVTAAEAPPILVVSTTGDPATPYENGVRVAERLASGVLVTFEGEGHTIVFQGSGCIDALAHEYLVDLDVPDDGVRC
ncbi:MAG: alpha/beta hydrolase, partial [Acidimicrobiales bacterium]|nr:alpha/beta hydrolase [Acidimicrobiales bacterium]